MQTQLGICEPIPVGFLPRTINVEALRIGIILLWAQVGIIAIVAMTSMILSTTVSLVVAKAKVKHVSAISTAIVVLVASLVGQAIGIAYQLSSGQFFGFLGSTIVTTQFFLFLWIFVMARRPINSVSRPELGLALISLLGIGGAFLLRVNDQLRDERLYFSVLAAGILILVWVVMRFVEINLRFRSVEKR